MAIKHATTAPRASLWGTDHVGDVDDLDDVTLTSIAAGDVLEWDGTGWVNGDGGGASLFTDANVSGAYEIDRADGETQDLTLVGNATFTLTGALTNRATDIRLVLRQDATGSRTVTWPTISWIGGSAPALQTTANSFDVIGLLTVDDGSTWFGFHAESSTLTVDDYPFHDEVLTDGSSNIIYAGGDVVMVTGVPN